MRSAFRLREGIAALASSPLLGDLKGREKESQFAWLLHEAGVVSLDRGAKEDVSDLGRKWRSAATQLGFLVPEISGSEIGLDQSRVGLPFSLTENGRRLIASETVPAMQECFLRSLAAYRIPSVLEKRYEVDQFSPLRHVISIMLELERRTGDSRLDFIEIAVVVQVTSPVDDLSQICDRILDFRSSRVASSNKRRFDNEALKLAHQIYDLAEGTFRDYADCNIRYLKATGIVSSAGRGISIIPTKRMLATQLIAQPWPSLSSISYLKQLFVGSPLPTDEKETAKLVLDDLIESARARGIIYDIAGRPAVEVPDISILRFEVEELIAEENEIAFAADQVNLVDEISAYLRLIAERGTSITLSNGESISLPKSEAPAYFEWATWRAFLAMRELVNKPYESRRFKVDQDFLPIGVAPGGGPDLICEFEDFLLVVEVTLTESSRQEAAEGESVRRHVAKVARDHFLKGGEKKVYGLFLANKIDSNTAETFRIGVWYSNDDSMTQLDIVPVSLGAFREFFISVFESGDQGHEVLRRILGLSIARRNIPGGGPVWKSEIDDLVRSSRG